VFDYYNKYLTDKPLEWNLIFAAVLVLSGCLGLFLYKKKPSIYFLWAGIDISFQALQFFIFGFILATTPFIFRVVDNLSVFPILLDFSDFYSVLSYIFQSIAPNKQYGPLPRRA